MLRRLCLSLVVLGALAVAPAAAGDGPLFVTQGGTGVVSKSGGLRYVAVGVPNVDQTELEAIQTSDGTVARWADLPGSWGIPSVGYPTAGYGAPGEGLRANRLLPGRIADRTQRSWVMQGSAVTRTTSEDGRWVYTLYTNPGGYPFVHALDTVRGVAHASACR